MEDEFAGVDLKRLTDLLEETEARHVQMRVPGVLHLVGCSCGISYGSKDRYAESHAHLREVLVRTVLEILSGPCESCRGSGVWRRRNGTFNCPECGGLGESLFPLPPMQYRDRSARVWEVVKELGDGRALVQCKGGEP